MKNMINKTNYKNHKSMNDTQIRVKLEQQSKEDFQTLVISLHTSDCISAEADCNSVFSVLVSRLPELISSEYNKIINDYEDRKRLFNKVGLLFPSFQEYYGVKTDSDTDSAECSPVCSDGVEVVDDSSVEVVDDATTTGKKNKRVKKQKSNA